MKGRGEREIPRTPPPPPGTNSIVWHDSHMRKSGVIRPGIETGSPCWEVSRLTAQLRDPSVSRRGRSVRGTEQRLNARPGGGTGVPRGNPPTSGIVRRDPHIRESRGTAPLGIEPASLWRISYPWLRADVSDVSTSGTSFIAASQVKVPAHLELSSTFEAERRRSDKCDTATHIKCAIGMEYGAAPECKGGGKREIPEKNLADKRETSDTIPTCENPGGTPPVIELGSSWREACRLTTILQRPRVRLDLQKNKENTMLHNDFPYVRRKHFARETYISQAIREAAVAEWLDCSPPDKANRLTPRPDHTQAFTRGNRAARCRWSADLLGNLPRSTALEFRR
ncbi:hypothetical protein PR048_032792 [Dryococelus australis]|uniref:Uncharacterized protein n=1 Tax=Dryococelus australis TaxID=614101 RepID=A0ABQ9G373_9NEOP|nr:hypothetical protein PR048_032792 [Dryococelus australis]